MIVVVEVSQKMVVKCETEVVVMVVGGV